MYDLSGYLLRRNYEQIQEQLRDLKRVWAEACCIIMADAWVNTLNLALVNFLVYFPKRIIFIKSNDASHAIKTGELLYGLFRKVVLDIGPQYVVQFVTDNVVNYVATGKLLEQEFRHLYWSPYAPPCLNLNINNFRKLDDVAINVLPASKISKLIYNHCMY